MLPKYGAASAPASLPSDGASTTQGKSLVDGEHGGALPSSPELEQIRAESRALTAVLSCLDAGKLSSEAHELVEDVFENHVVDSVEANTIGCAMSRLMGVSHKVEIIEPVAEPADQRIFELTCRAWIAWACRQESQEELDGLRGFGVPGEQAKGRALHLMALHPWALAVDALLTNNREEARRQYRRATELGAQFGTESNPVVQWTYAASFLTT